MPEFDYAGLRDTVVQPNIADFGKQVDGVLKIPGTPTGPAYNPQPGDDVEQAVTCMEGSFTQKDVAGTNVQMTDTLFLVSPEGVTADPTLADRIEVENQEYQVVMVKRLRTGSVTMFWRVFARK